MAPSPPPWSWWPAGGIEESTTTSSGSSPTSHGYTGQQADGATGLDYYHARYYDPVAGQFTSADSVADGLNRYGYVAGNPTTATDPSGHRVCADESCDRHGSGGGSGGSGGSGGGSSGSGGSGGSGGGDGGDPVTHDCKTDLSDASVTCALYRDWETRMKHKRWEALSDARNRAGIMLLLAGVADIIADGIVIAHGGLVEKILAAIDGLLVVAFGLLPAVQLLSNDEAGYSPNANATNGVATGAYAGGGAVLATLAGFATLAKAAVDKLRGVLDLIKKLGSWGEKLADVAVFAAQELLGGPGMAIVRALLAIAGRAGEALIEGGVHVLYAMAYSQKGAFDSQLNMDIGDWCAQNKHTRGEAPPPRYHTV